MRCRITSLFLVPAVTAFLAACQVTTGQVLTKEQVSGYAPCKPIPITQASVNWAVFGTVIEVKNCPGRGNYYSEKYKLVNGWGGYQEANADYVYFREINEKIFRESLSSKKAFANKATTIKLHYPKLKNRPAIFAQTRWSGKSLIYFVMNSGFRQEEGWDTILRGYLYDDGNMSEEAFQQYFLERLRVIDTSAAERFIASKKAIPAGKSVQRIKVKPAPSTSGATFRDCSECPEMVVVPAGSFRMGDLNGGGGDDEKPVHKVTIPKPFAVGKYEVTQAEWNALIGINPSRFRGDRNPVEQVSWEDAKAFVRKLIAKTGKQYRLLSESEWEYAARAGTTTSYFWGNFFHNEGSNNANCEECGSRWDGKETAPVGSFGSNRFGLHDMHGNVWEWVEDCRHSSYNGAPSTGEAWITKGCAKRVLRGGSWLYNPWNSTSANRSGNKPTFRDVDYGFRVARTLETP